MIRWREKLLAFAIHFAVTAAVATAAAALIFLVWYPEPFHDMMGGTELFLLVVGSDLVLGPLLSLVIYDGRKTRGKLLFDYGVVAVLQLAALAYGVYVVRGARPVWIAWVGDRYEVVSAADLAEADLAEARDPAFRRRPGWGPQLVAVEVPAAERNEALFAALEGKDVHLRPRFYVTYDSRLGQLRQRALPVAELLRRHPEAAPRIEAARKGLDVPEEELRWQPVRCRQGFWTALIDLRSSQPVRYLPIDPYPS
jgi:hypothetical protein